MYDDVQIKCLFSFWGEMTPSQRERLLKRMVPHFYTNGMRINLFSTPEKIWGVVKGRFSIIMHAEDGKQIQLLCVRQGDCGISPFSPRNFVHNYYMEAVVETDTEICVLTGLDDETLPTEELQEFERNWNQRIVSSLTNLIGDLVFSTLDERLIRLLRKYGSQQNTRVIAITHEKLAQELGTSREVISRLLMQMARTGIVELKRKQIRLC